MVERAEGGAPAVDEPPWRTGTIAPHRAEESGIPADSAIRDGEAGAGSMGDMSSSQPIGRGGENRGQGAPDAATEYAAIYLPTIVTVEWRGAWRAAGAVAAALGPLHVITAWNPGDERPSMEENGRRNALLHADLVALGLDPHPALGSDPRSTHAESSWAVTGISDADACALGAKYGQVAVFRITADTQTVLGCFAPWSVSRPLDGDGS
jgi:hypothetical protein